MFQHFALFPHMNVWQNVSFGPTIKNREMTEVENLTSEILEMVKLADRPDALPKELSGGMQQRVALARGIASGAKILLLDEPLGALDARLRVNLRSQIRRLVKDQNLTAIHVTHDQEEALMIADRIVILRKGKIEQIGTPIEIYSHPNSIFVANFVGGATFLEGNVSQVTDSESYIDLHGDLTLHVLNRGISVGKKVVVAVRLEHVSLGSDPVAGSNNFVGIVKSAIFVGGSIDYQIQFENGDLIDSKSPFSADFKSYDNDEKLIVSIPPDQCHVFPYPRLGLLKELEVI
jgi:ABC-type Fe3+/spermidine/putrescine transport system ATPase subunit